MKKRIQNIISKGQEAYYHRAFNSAAIKALKNIEKNTKYKLQNKIKSEINEYSKDVLGSLKYAPWLYVYTAYNQSFKEGWIPDNYYSLKVLPEINNEFRKISSIKTISKKILQTELLPDKFYLINNILYDENNKIIENEKIHKKIFEEEEELFLKSNDSSQSKGITKLKKNEFNLDVLLNSNNAVIQKSIKQHDWFNEIITGSVATLRITTVKNNQGIIKLVGSFLRIAKNKSEYVDPIDTLRINVIDKEGTINNFGIDPDWKAYYKHPITNYNFEKQIIPNYKSAVKACIKIHENLPQVGIIGWDVAINKEGEPEIMEWNAGHPDIKFIEASSGPCFTNLNWEKLNEN